MNKGFLFPRGSQNIQNIKKTQSKEAAPSTIGIKMRIFSEQLNSYFTLLSAIGKTIFLGVNVEILNMYLFIFLNDGSGSH